MADLSDIPRHFEHAPDGHVHVTETRRTVMGRDTYEQEVSSWKLFHTLSVGSLALVSLATLGRYVTGVFGWSPDNIGFYWVVITLSLFVADLVVYLVVWRRDDAEQLTREQCEAEYADSKIGAEPQTKITSAEPQYGSSHFGSRFFSGWL